VTAPGNEHGGQSITIGLRELYNQLQETSRNMVSLSAKIDSTLISQTMAQQSIAAQLADLRHDFADHETRIRMQESKTYITPRGMWTGIGVVSGVMGTLFTILQVILSH
jgi:hypothetical protein